MREGVLVELFWISGPIDLPGIEWYLLEQDPRSMRGTLYLRAPSQYCWPPGRPTRGLSRESGGSSGSQNSGGIPMARSSLSSVCSINRHGRCSVLLRPRYPCGTVAVRYFGTSIDPGTFFHVPHPRCSSVRWGSDCGQLAGLHGVASMASDLTYRLLQ
jgi:hypothetical protein